MSQSKRSVAEWMTFAVASFILFTIFGLIGYSWLTKPQEPPLLTVRQAVAVPQANGQFYVPFEVLNTGGETAEAIQIIAELRVDGQIQETGEQQVDFLSRREKEEGVFIFSRDPRQGQVIVRVASYKQP
jgi:uncharacterized protein (TIGR02588 family)